MVSSSRRRIGNYASAFVIAIVFALTLLPGSDSVAQETLTAGCSGTVTWDATIADTVETVDIQLVDGEGELIQTLAEGTAHDGSQDVDVPCIEGEMLDAQIRIIANETPPFTISTTPVTIVAVGPTIDASAQGGSVDDNCELMVTFDATIMDDCGVDAEDVTVMVMQIGSMATVGEPTIEIADTAGIEVFGTVLVSALTGSPALIAIKISAADNCSTVTTFMDTVMVVDDTPPVVMCPGDTTVECSSHGGTPATDPQLAEYFSAFSATDNCDSDPSLSNDAPEYFPLGTTVVTFMATDASGNSSECTATVEVVDTTPPDITVMLNRYALWPPNHKFHDITAEVDVTDICDPEPTFVLTAVESNEAPNGHGDGNTQPDFHGADTGTADLMFELRAERAGGGDGRVYTIIYTASDESGNTASDSATVVVPHDMRGKAKSSNGYNNIGTGFDAASNQVVLIVPARGDDPGEIHDPADIDVFRAQIGNIKGVVSPEKVYRGDVDGDTYDDIVIAYPMSAADDLFLKAKGHRDNTSLHYADFTGRHWVVYDIFDLGSPTRVDLSNLTEIEAVEEPAGGGTTDGGDGDGGGEIVTQEPDVKKTGLWLASHPNPFNPQTTITFGLPEAGMVSVRVYDARGQLIRTLLRGVQTAGEHSVKWNGLNDRGIGVGSGIYFLRLETPTTNVTRKLVMLK